MNLLCPKCNLKLKKYQKQFVCENNHSFDISKEGYVNLLLKQSKPHGDNKQMINARTNFLRKGYYSFLKDKLVNIIDDLSPTTLCDLGCGEGYYTSSFKVKNKIGFDMSKDALKHASKYDISTQYAIASIFHLPLNDSCCDCVVTCFAPIAKSEIIRILKKNGYFICVTPGPKHLFELKELLYETPYENRIEEINWSLKKNDEFIIKNTFKANSDDLDNLFLMTPYAYRTRKRGIDCLHKTSDLDITAEFIIRIFRNE